MSMRQTLHYTLSSTGMDSPDSIYEVDESPLVPPRLDAPVELESRGTTSQAQTLQNAEEAALHQFLLWSTRTVHKNSTAAKLRSVGRDVEAEKLEKCHTIYTVAQCRGCGQVQKFPNRCDLFYCAECQPRLSNDRRRAVEWWTREVRNPWHVVLTLKNTPDLCRGHKTELLKWFNNLRRRKFARCWLGGFYRIEVTNEGRGWHLHLHALVDARYINEPELSEQWQSVTNGFGRIVRARRCWNNRYLAEVTKYAVKGSMLAAWSPEQIVTFIDAFDGAKTFGVFGSLYGKRTEFAEWFRQVRDSKPPCKCGCTDMHYFTEAQFIEKDFVATSNVESIPPPKPPDNNLTFGFAEAPQFGPR